MFNSHGYPGSPSAHSAANLIRWALKLSTYRYTIEHVAGSDNVCSDMLTLWAAPPTLVRISTTMLSPVSPSSDESFVWPTAQKIRRVQDAALIDAALLPDIPVLSQNDIYRTSVGQVWIPEASTDLSYV
jgi:hypothetical protein